MCFLIHTLQELSGGKNQGNKTFITKIHLLCFQLLKNKRLPTELNRTASQERSESSVISSSLSFCLVRVCVFVRLQCARLGPLCGGQGDAGL